MAISPDLDSESGCDPSLGSRLTRIQRGDPGLGRSLARAGLGILSWGWSGAQWLKGAAYASGLRRSERLDVPVISVGNLAVGGTGKTPFVAWLVAHLRNAGRSPGVLARGYGAPAAGDGTALNDEGAVLHHLLGADLPQVQDPDRVRGGRALRAAHPEVDVLVLDDGYQHRRVARDLDLVLLDATRPFGFGHVLPRGLLREGPAALARADAVILTRTERVTPAAIETAVAAIRAVFTGPLALARTEPRPDSLREELAGARVYAFCAIGNPEAFVGTLTDLGAQVVGSRFLDDHRALPASAWPAVLAEAREAGAECVVTTRKDAVKYEVLPSEVTVVDMELVIYDGEDALLEAVRAVL